MPIRLNDFEMPKKVVKEESTKTFGRYTAEPFEIGYARTIGNSLRRVLLSSIEGFAVSSVRITGAEHEFCSLPGVKEDVTSIILALKKVLVSSAVKEPKKVLIKRHGPCVVTAKDIEEECPALKVLNPKHPIATVNDTGDFEMELTITRGRGFCPASWDVDPSSPDARPRQRVIGEIPVDRIYSPVTRVNFDVSDCRVGQRTDYEKLVLEITTDGRIDPDDALVHAAAILRQHLDVFVAFKQGVIEEVEEAEAPVEKMTDDLAKKFAMSITELEFGVRSSNSMNEHHITTVGQLCNLSREEILKYRNLGKISVSEIESQLAKIGLSLGMQVPASFLPPKTEASDGAKPTAGV